MFSLHFSKQKMLVVFHDSLYTWLDKFEWLSSVGISIHQGFTSKLLFSFSYNQGINISCTYLEQFILCERVKCNLFILVLQRWSNEQWNCHCCHKKWCRFWRRSAEGINTTNIQGEHISWNIGLLAFDVHCYCVWLKTLAAG